MENIAKLKKFMLMIKFSLKWISFNTGEMIFNFQEFIFV